MSHLIPFLLAAATGLDSLDSSPLPPQGPGNLFFSQWRDVLLIAGAALLMGLTLFLWAFLTRRRRQRNFSSARGSRVIFRAEKGEPSGHHHGHGRRRRRRDHSDRLSRNPTLAEAGGLPPLRPEDPEPTPEAKASPRPSVIPPPASAR